MMNERIAEALLLLDAADQMAQGLLAADDIDFKVVIPALQILMPAIAFVHMCGLLELCPTHCTDVQTCADDEADCPAGKGTTK